MCGACRVEALSLRDPRPRLPFMKHDELMPPRPGRRSWTRAEDYLPPRRNRRASSGQPLTARPANLGSDEVTPRRPLLGLVPFVLLMLALGVLAAAIAVAAWPGRPTAKPAAPRVAAEETTITLDPTKAR